MGSGYLKPGRQNLVVLDARLNPDTGLLEEALFSKEVLIEHRQGDLNAMGPDAQTMLDAFINDRLTGQVTRYRILQAQLVEDAKDALKKKKAEARRRAKKLKEEEARKAAEQRDKKKKEPKKDGEGKAKGKKKKK